MSTFLGLVFKGELGNREPPFEGCWLHIKILAFLTRCRGRGSDIIIELFEVRAHSGRGRGNRNTMMLTSAISDQHTSRIFESIIEQS